VTGPWTPLRSRRISAECTTWSAACTASSCLEPTDLRSRKRPSVPSRKRWRWIPAGLPPTRSWHWRSTGSPARRAATKSQAHASLGFVLLHYDWDLEGAERAIRRALELDRNSHHWTYASYLQAAGRHDEAIAHFHGAEERNPRSERLKMQVAAAYSCAGRHREAVAQITELQTRMGGVLRSGLVGDAAGTGLLGFAERLYSLMGRHHEAIALAEEAVVLTDSLPVAVVNLAFVYARAGRIDEARRLADRMEERAQGERRAVPAGTALRRTG
jgi:tetratricopeptide (TPR) repeat protein